jgi:hypothetical protein
MNPTFDSTVAMTLYNVLCMSKGTATKDHLIQQSRSLHLPYLEVDQFERSLARLVKEGFVSIDGETVKGADPENRHVLSRSLADTALGPIEGGWKGWIVRDLSGGGNKLRTLTSVMEEVRNDVR